MKRRSLYLIASCLFISLFMTSCHKVCTCTGYDGREHEYTSDEVDAHAHGNCSDMTDFPITNHYSYCHW